MDHPTDRLTPGTQIGDYHLTELLYDGQTTRTWKAQQISVDREVVIDSLNQAFQDDEGVVAAFIHDVRAKANVDHPLIGSVFEAVQERRFCFYARENLTGDTLEELQQSAKQLKPERVIHIIHQIAEANLYLEEHKVASLPIQTDQIYISEHYLTRLINMAVGGKRDHSVSTQDKHTIATALLGILKPACPGSTRTRSLLSYMADLEREIPLTWEQILGLSEEVEHHLYESSEPLASGPSTTHLYKRDDNKKVAGFIAAVIIVIGIYAIVSLVLNQPSKPKQRELTCMVAIPAGSYSTHDGLQTILSPFWIDAHEVTIAEYAKFLKAMNILSPQQRAIYQHENQPEEKTDHLPNDWGNYYQAAKNGRTWRNLPMDPNCPVTGIDWWDAYTYASYKRRRLPSQEEWHAALQHSLKADQALTPSPWGQVDHDPADSTKNGIYGLAGNVSEWCSKMSKDPVFPTKPKMPLLLGGSYLKNHSSATSREWLNAANLNTDDARNLRRLDIGFRTVSSSAPTE